MVVIQTICLQEVKNFGFKGTIFYNYPLKNSGSSQLHIKSQLLPYLFFIEMPLWRN